MRANVEIADRLLATVMNESGAKTKREVIHQALSALVQEPPDYSELRALAGKDLIDPDYDPKTLVRSRAETAL